MTAVQLVDPRTTPGVARVEYRAVRGYLYVSRGDAYVADENGRLAQVQHGDTLTVPCRNRRPYDRARVEALLAKVPHLRARIIEDE
jgi:hypothetical protein